MDMMGIGQGRDKVKTKGHTKMNFEGATLISRLCISKSYSKPSNKIAPKKSLNESPKAIKATIYPKKQPVPFSPLLHYSLVFVKRKITPATATKTPKILIIHSQVGTIQAGHLSNCIYFFEISD
jgi:hypothetical protein